MQNLQINSAGVQVEKKNPTIRKLTVRILKAMHHGEIVGSGEVFIPVLYAEGNIKWIAKRGGYPDWAIYYGQAFNSYDYITKYGQKIINREIITSLIPCTSQALDIYRY